MGNKCICGHIQTAHLKNHEEQHVGACCAVISETETCTCSQYQPERRRVYSEEERARRTRTQQSVVIISMLNEQRRMIESLEKRMKSLENDVNVIKYGRET